MTITVQQIAQSQEVLGSHVQHLAKNPKDFLALTKLNIVLAQRYARAFSAGHALTLFAIAQAQGLRLATEIISLDPYAIAMRNDSLNFGNKSESELRSIADGLKSALRNTVTTKSLRAYDDDDCAYSYTQFTRKYYHENVTIFETQDNNDDDYHEFKFYNNYQINLESAYKHSKHPEWVIAQKYELMTGLLSKLDSTVFLLNKAKNRVGVLDAEFTQQSSFSRLFSASRNPLDQLAENQHYGVAGKIISLLSPVLAMRELQKPRLGNKNLMERFIAEIPKTPQPTAQAIERMGSLPEPLFESLIAGFHFDILGQIKAQCENLAKAFYSLAPGFMQRQYPKAAEPFIESVCFTFPADKPPVYEISKSAII